jgi:FkbM family methyltransferase
MYHKYIFSEVIKKIIHDIKFFRKIKLSKLIKSIRFIKKSKAQLRQDLFVLTHLDFKTQGFFVEFGATDGIHLSNSYLLEREFDWSGILAEPAKSFEVALRHNRPNAKIETLCIYKDSDLILNFRETSDSNLSTLDYFANKDFHKRGREKYISYQVKTISLNDLLEKYNAPTQIDYLSIDTEGSELEILTSFDFKKYNVKIITVEHNYSPQLNDLSVLLISEGYEQKFANLSKFDSWWIKI